MKPSVIVWDLETVPDLAGFAAANDLVGKSDVEVREAIGEKVPNGENSQNGRYGIFRRGRADQSALMPANLITLAHFSVSSAMSLPKSAGEPASTVPPSSVIRAFIVGSASAAFISRLSMSMMSGAVLLGAPTPNQVLASKPGKIS